ncbi:unnamed protein product [Pleuronectes platessa]|uniref:Uncharacterized protein n=1 Tax=Pleuronectes platessa TaxID=8262 RepID=A0A9N7VFF3_PLEPL|nr:unnamed protein product [Pleuronectes platessa]
MVLKNASSARGGGVDHGETDGKSERGPESFLSPRSDTYGLFHVDLWGISSPEAMGQLWIFQSLWNEVQTRDGELIRGQSFTVPEAATRCSCSCGGCATAQ